MTSTMELAAKHADAVADFALIELQLTADMKPMKEAHAALEQRIKELERDAARYRWLRDGNNDKLTMAKRIAENHYGMEWDSLIDRAMSEAALTKAVDISQEYKLP